MPTLPTVVGVKTALLLPTIVNGDEAVMSVDPAAKVPLTSTTDLEDPVWVASPTPAWELHTGACAVPAFASLHVLPTGPT